MMSYEYSINNILRDKAQGWSLDYYLDKRTSYDVPLARAQAMLELMEKESELQVAQKKYASFLAASKGAGQRIKDDIKAVESVISQLKGDISRLSFISNGAYRPPSFLRAHEAIDTLLTKRMLEKQRLMLLHSARNIFMRNGNEQEMRQSVEAAETRFSAAMASLEPAPGPAPEPAPVAAPEPAAGQEPAPKKRNRHYSEDDDDWEEPEQLKGWRNKEW